MSLPGRNETFAQVGRILPSDNSAIRPAIALGQSTFTVYLTPPPGGPQNGTPTFIAILDQGPITLLDSVSVAEFAPEPSAWLLAALGGVVVAARAARRVARAQA